MFKSKINYILLAIILTAVGLYLNSSINSVLNGISNDISNASVVNKIIIKEIEVLKEVEAPPKINVEYNNPLIEANCGDGGSFYYWDFTAKEDSWSQRSNGYDKGNFYIDCNNTGSLRYGSAILFKNNKPIFKTGPLAYEGVFMDYDNYFYTTEGALGENSACPKSYTLKKYKYNSKTELMDLIETKEYLTEKIKTGDSAYTCTSEELIDFVKTIDKIEY